jgi:RHS repeat-associated protein
MKTTKPSLSALVTDPDGGTVTGRFSMLSGATPVWDKLAGTTVASGAKSVFTPSASTPALTEGGTYTQQVWADDGTQLSRVMQPWTFIVDTTAPVKPALTASGYTDGQWKDTAPAENTFTFSTTATDVPYFEYSLDGGAWTQAPTSGATPTATLVWNPTSGGHTFAVRAIDKAGWASPETSFTFGAGGVALAAPSTGLKSTDTFQVKASAPPAGGGTVTPSIWWRVAGSAEPTDFDPAKGSTTGWTKAKDLTAIAAGKDAAVNTDWSAATAAKSIAKERGPLLLDMQVCFTYSANGAVRCTWTSNPAGRSSVVHVPHAFGDNYPTAEAGPGQVALWTGEFNTSATDVSVPGYVGDLSLSRTYSSQAGTDDASVFGPGWRASFDGTDIGIAGFEIVDGTDIDGTISLVDSEGGAMVFRQPGGTQVAMKIGQYTPADEDTTTSGAKLALAGAGSSANLTFTEDDGTVTTFTFSDAVNGKRIWLPSSVTEPGAAGKTTFTRDAATKKITRVLAPVPPGVTCPATGPLNPGCRAISIAYGTTTGGKEVAGQVKSVSYEAFNPDKAGGAGMDSVVVATYEYDATKRLAKVNDPRSGLSAAYEYTGTSTSGQPLLTKVTPSGLAPITLAYGTSSQDTSSLLTVDRAPATAGGNATRLARFVYGIDPAAANTALPSLKASDVSTWGQPKAPTYGAAVFSADRQQIAGSAPGDVTAADWPFADLQYTDADGRVVNTAAHGAGDWQVTADRFDAGGRVIHQLDQRATAQLRSIATTGAPSAAVIDSYATITRYNADITASAAITHDGGTIAAGTVLTPAGTLVTDVWEPARETNNGLGRKHTRTEYDQGAPNSGVNPKTGIAYRLPTTTTMTEAEDLTGSADVTVPVPTGEPVLSHKTVGYDTIDGKPATDLTSGWYLGQATRTTTVMGAGQADIVTSTRYDAEGKVVETRRPGSDGTDAGTQLSSYYTAAPQTGVFAACGTKPEWAGLPCANRTAESTPTLPIETTTRYSMYLAAQESTETRGGTTRTSTTTYDAAGRPTLAHTVSNGLTGSTPVADARTTYDLTTGLTASVTSLDPSGNETARIETGYDKWGRATTYRAADGATTTTTYDAAGRVATVADPLRTVQYSYDSNTEHRGFPTSVTIPGTGTFTATYDATGSMVSQSLLGRATQRVTYDRAGEMTGLDYTSTVGSAEVSLLSWDLVSDVLGRTTSTTSTAASGRDRVNMYAYDRAERLVGVEDTSDAICTTRTYGFDERGNRLNQAAATHGAACDSAATATTTKTWAFDRADRVQSGATINGAPAGAAYVYDQLGRQTTVPAIDTPQGVGAGDLTIGYYDTDAARTLTQNGQTTTYALDPAGRRTTATTTGVGAGTLVRHYTDTSDNPGYAVKTTSNGTPVTTWYGASIGGDLGVEITGDVASLTLADPLGSIATEVVIPPAGQALQLGAIGSHDEYGNVLTTANQTGAVNYGWLGAKERALDATGLTLMGARLYNPVSGLFTSVDPIEGGNTTAYTYPQDPQNKLDLSGEFALALFAPAAVFAGANAWNPVGWVVAGVILVAAVGVSVYAGYTWWQKRKARNADRAGHGGEAGKSSKGSKARTGQKHEKAQSHGGRTKPNFQKYNPKKPASSKSSKPQKKKK